MQTNLHYIKVIVLRLWTCRSGAVAPLRADDAHGGTHVTPIIATRGIVAMHHVDAVTDLMIGTRDLILNLLHAVTHLLSV